MKKKHLIFAENQMFNSIIFKCVCCVEIYICMCHLCVILMNVVVLNLNVVVQRIKIVWSSGVILRSLVGFVVVVSLNFYRIHSISLTKSICKFNTYVTSAVHRMWTFDWLVLVFVFVVIVGFVVAVAAAIVVVVVVFILLN